MTINIDGKDYVPHDDGSGDFTLRLVKPIVKQPKWEVTLFQALKDRQLVTLILDDLSKDQAQLIKQSVEALMEHLTNSDYYDIDTPNDLDLMDAISTARSAMRNK